MFFFRVDQLVSIFCSLINDHVRDFIFFDPALNFYCIQSSYFLVVEQRKEQMGLDNFLMNVNLMIQLVNVRINLYETHLCQKVIDRKCLRCLRMHCGPELNQNPDVSTGPLARVFAHLLTPLVRLLRPVRFARALCCSHLCAHLLTSLTPSLMGK